METFFSILSVSLTSKVKRDLCCFLKRIRQNPWDSEERRSLLKRVNDSPLDPLARREDDEDVDFQKNILLETSMKLHWLEIQREQENQADFLMANNRKTEIMSFPQVQESLQRESKDVILLSSSSSCYDEDKWLFRDLQLTMTRKVNRRIQFREKRCRCNRYGWQTLFSSPLTSSTEKQY